MLRYVFTSLLVLLTFARPLAADAQDVALDLDPAQSTVDFTLGAFLHTVHGSFKLKSGTIRWDTATGSAQGEIDIDLTTGATGNGSRDDVMRGSVLEVQHDPDAVFTADTVTGQLNPNGPSTLNIHGRLSIHGAIHDWTMQATVLTNGTQLTATTHFTIPYAQWGMKNPSTFLLHVNDHVEVNVRASAHVRPVS
jgi:polyisoprenoid-binding protein YceI